MSVERNEWVGQASDRELEAARELLRALEPLTALERKKALHIALRVLWAGEQRPAVHTCSRCGRQRRKRERGWAFVYERPNHSVAEPEPPRRGSGLVPSRCFCSTCVEQLGGRDRLRGP